MPVAPWHPSIAELARLHDLAPSGAPVAFVAHADGVWAARSVFDLVDGVWFAHPDQAHRILRARVLTNGAASDVSRSIVQLCARKLGAGLVGASGPVPDVEVHWMDVHAEASRAHHVSLSTLPLPEGGLQNWLCPKVDAGPLRHRDRPVRALLLAPDGRPLAAARNTNGSHRLRHAEVNLLQQWGRPLPEGSTLLVGLQCCRMCAAMVVDAAEGPITVRFLRPETGRFGQATALQRAGWEAALGPVHDAAQHQS